jgi:hypothetical protein
LQIADSRLLLCKHIAEEHTDDRNFPAPAVHYWFVTGFKHATSGNQSGLQFKA